MNEEDIKIITKYLMIKINNRKAAAKYRKTDKGKISKLSYYYRKNNIYHPLYNTSGEMIKKYNKDGTMNINKSYAYKHAKEWYYQKVKNIYHPIYNPNVTNEGKKYKRIDFEQ